MRKLKLLLLTVALPMLAVLLWGFVALRNHRPNGFVRKFATAPALLKETKVVVPLTGICGIANSTIYFKSNTPNRIYSLTSNLTNLYAYEFLIETNQSVHRNFDVAVDSPFIYLYAGNLMRVCSGMLTSKDSLNCQTISQKFFTNAHRINSSRFLVRSYKHSDKDFVLQKTNQYGQQIATDKTPLLKHDMGFSSQLSLLYDKPRRHILLVYKLLNSIICLDSNLNKVYAVHTIDTIQNTAFKYEVVKRHKEKKGTIASAPKYTNYRACLDGSKLYIYSLLKADNEIDPNAPVIDVYDVSNGAYTYSFELPLHDNQKLSDFKVRDGKLIALYKGKSQIKIYQLNPSY